jgi:hypothetical protein
VELILTSVDASSRRYFLTDLGYYLYLLNLLLLKRSLIDEKLCGRGTLVLLVLTTVSIDLRDSLY